MSAPIFNSRGSLNLITVLMGATLASVLFLNMSSSIKTAFRAAQGFSNKIQIERTVLLIDRILRKPEHCAQYLGGLQFDSSKTSESISGIEIYFPEHPTRVIAKSGLMINPTLRLQDVALKDFSKISEDNYLASLNVVGDNKSGIGGRTLSKGTHVELTTKNLSDSDPTQKEIVACQILGSHNEAQPHAGSVSQFGELWSVSPLDFKSWERFFTIPEGKKLLLSTVFGDDCGLTGPHTPVITFDSYPPKYLGFYAIISARISSFTTFLSPFPIVLEAGTYEFDCQLSGTLLDDDDAEPKAGKLFGFSHYGNAYSPGKYTVPDGKSLFLHLAIPGVNQSCDIVLPNGDPYRVSSRTQTTLYHFTAPLVFGPGEYAFHRFCKFTGLLMPGGS